MKHFFQSLVSWWFAAMTPAHVPETTLAERENIRKRRLLSIILLVSIAVAIIYLALDFRLKNLSLAQALTFFAVISVLGGALWLNRQGYLKLASLIFFFSNGAAFVQGVHVASSADPFLLFWICFLSTAFLVMQGLFLSAWLLILLAVIEYLTIIWYLLVLNHALVIHLLSPVALQDFLFFLTIMIYDSALVSIIYSITTKKAVIQADRASELEQANAKLEEAYTTIQRQALTDGLTGLPNHRAVMDQLQKEMDRARRYNRPFSVLFFDGDRFKKVNDTYGHAVGDTVLYQIGAYAGSELRGGDTLGRFGGEEFVVLLPEAAAHEAAVIAERIRAAVAARPVPTTEVEGGVAMTVSIGLATYPSDGTSEEELLAQADAAMYVAKRLGRNQVRTAEEARHMSTDVELVALLHHEGQRDAAEREGITPEQVCETYTLRAICSLTNLLERRDVGLSAHAHAVSDLATAIASAMRLDPREVSRIGMAALLHDIGKIAMPDALLQQSAPLSSQERVLLHEHAEVGAQILEASPFLCDLIPMVRHHHERWDGSGYPEHLRGKDIPLEARIIAVAEAYDAMQREHPYHTGFSLERTLAELRQGAGTQFDPEVVHVLLALLAKQPETIASMKVVR
ncbi:MAG: diguanylate cyclase [Ktedonobacteraceae bacterium]|nr:diguanylate cyclase [Ktedonobacteraceae bacterium]